VTLLLLVVAHFAGVFWFAACTEVVQLVLFIGVGCGIEEAALLLVTAYGGWIQASHPSWLLARSQIKHAA
jgi:hypothetical protein